MHAIESVTRLPAYRDAVLSRSPETERRDFGPRGAFMGYDFHLAHDGARLIEINTNAGGAFLNALLTAARLYQGQATNFRMPGSGFAPVFVI